MSFSPDGSKLVFSWQPTPKVNELFTAKVDGSDFQLLAGTSDAFSPAWSPDGRYILFAARHAAGSGSAKAPATASTGSAATHSPTAAPGSAAAPGSTAAPAAAGLELYDTESQQVRTLQPGVFSPLIWRQDHLRLGGVLQKGGHSNLYLYDLQGGGTMMDMSLPVSSVLDHNTSMVWAPDTDLVALVGDSNVYMEEQGVIHPISTTSDVIGLGLASGGKGLIWARRERYGKNVFLSLYRFDLSARSAAKLAFPAKGAVVPSSLNGQAGAPEYVVFSPNGTRVAEVATVTVPPIQKKDGPSLYRAVYVSWLDGSGAHLVAQTPDPTPLPAAKAPQTPDRLIPTWSPNNLDLAVQEIGATPSVKVYHPDGKVSRIAPHAG